MKLEAWLRQERTLADRLLVVERLSQALNQVHDRGEPLAALQPDNVEVAGDGRCDLSDALRGTPAAGYVAPERTEGGSASPEADIYAAGAIAWEVLAGRPCGPSPTHLSEASPELPQELADAVMACLERSPQWRPRDLTYLAQLAQHAQGPHRGPEAPATPRTAAPRPATRTSSARGARSAGGPGADAGATTRLRLAIGTLLVLGAAGGGAYLWSSRSTDRSAAHPPSTIQAVAPRPAATMPQPAGGAATPAPSATPIPATGSPVLSSAAQPAAATPQPTPTPAAAPASAAAEPAPRVVAQAVSTTAAPPAAAQAAPAEPAAALPPAPGEAAPAAEKAAPAPRAPLALGAISPLSARRPGKVLLDLRGSGMHDGVRVHVLPLRESPRGISIVRQKCEGDTLIRVLLDLDAQVAPGAYAIAIEDADGRQTKPLTFTVTR